MAIIYFLFSGKKKKPLPKPTTESSQEKERPVFSAPARTTPSKPVSSPAVPPTEADKPFSLEDILKQLGELESEKEKANKEEDYPAEQILEKEIPRKTPIINYDEITQKEEAISSETKIEEDPARWDRDSHYALTSKTKNKYAEMLKDPEGLKTAFIASEIFNRKY